MLSYTYATNSSTTYICVNTRTYICYPGKVGDAPSRVLPTHICVHVRVPFKKGVHSSIAYIRITHMHIAEIFLRTYVCMLSIWRQSR